MRVPEVEVLWTAAAELAAGGEPRLDPEAAPAATVHCRTT